MLKYGLKVCKEVDNDKTIIEIITEKENLSVNEDAFFTKETIETIYNNKPAKPSSKRYSR